MYNVKLLYVYNDGLLEVSIKIFLLILEVVKKNL